MVLFSLMYPNLKDDRGKTKFFYTYPDRGPVVTKF